ncbi:MAG: hypothetical protein V1494_02975 [Candidatus Diapherotrites archaeon]
MALSSSILYAARRNTPPAKAFDPKKPINNLIDASGGAEAVNAAGVGASASAGLGAGVSGNGGEKAFSGVKWEDCAHLNKKGDRAYCKAFVSYCAGDKCKPKFRKAKA